LLDKLSPALHGEGERDAPPAVHPVRDRCALRCARNLQRCAADVSISGRYPPQRRTRRCSQRIFSTDREAVDVQGERPPDYETLEMIRPSPHGSQEDGAKSQSHRILHQAEAAADVVAFDADADLVRVAEEGGRKARVSTGGTSHAHQCVRAQARARIHSPVQ
jgi:hypothetical protein